MTVSKHFVTRTSPSYVLGLANPQDTQRVEFLNGFAALLPKAETDLFPAAPALDLLQRNRWLSNNPSNLPDKVQAVFKTLFSTLENLVHLEGDNVVARVGAQPKALEAFNEFNKTNDAYCPSPLMMTKEGRFKFAELNRIRDVYTGMQHSGLGATSYEVNYNR